MLAKLYRRPTPTATPNYANWPKFIDGLRSVAATISLEEPQEQRATFVKTVQDAVGADIQNNGLELKSVSLTRLDAREGTGAVTGIASAPERAFSTAGGTVN